MDNWHKTDIKLRLDLMVDGEGLLDRVVKLKNAANEAAVLATGIDDGFGTHPGENILDGEQDGEQEV